MELDELKQKWAEHDRKLDQSIRLNRQLLRETYTRRARFALWRLAAMLAAGSIFMLMVIVWLGYFISQAWSSPRFVWPAVALDLMAISLLALLIVQVALSLKMDYDQPVGAIQKRLEALRKVRVRYIQGIFLFAVLAWMPLFILAMKVFLGVDVYRSFPTSWIVTNVAFGFAALAIGIWWSRKHGSRFLRELAGYNLNAASRFLATLTEFEKE
jgi:MFS family permease